MVPHAMLHMLGCRRDGSCRVPPGRWYLGVPRGLRYLGAFGTSGRSATGRIGSTTMLIRLDGSCALVTGGSKGIGKAIATALALSGADVLISSRKPEGCAAAAAEIAAAVNAAGENSRVEWFASNAGEPDQAAACVTTAIERFGKVDILINNAAANPYMGPIIDIDASRAAKTVQVNQYGYVMWANLVWHGGMKEHGGAILNISSVGGLSVEESIGYYNVTKAAVLHLTRQLASELAPKVRVNALAPGLVKTDFAKALWEPAEPRIAARMPLRRLGEPEDIANAAVFLCSSAASWITGTHLVIDGGALTGPALS
jgi:NAD(P)-dependent dehydrogenase (short-subunit alcohol dehydrogenase family)